MDASIRAAAGGFGSMKIIDVVGTNLTIPYPGEVRPAWQPGLVATSHNFTLVRIVTDQGITGLGGTSGHLAGAVSAHIRCATGEPAARLARNAFGTERGLGAISRDSSTN